MEKIRKRSTFEVGATDFKRLKIDNNEPEPTNYHSDSESYSSEFSETALGSGKQTPSTPQSSKDWPSLKKTISCVYPGCDKKFNRQAKLRDHLRYHTGERPFVCSHGGCLRSFPRKTHLDRHVKSAHTDVRDHRCSYFGCGKAFSTGTRLRRHEAAHQKRTQFTCDECGQEFRKHSTLQKHESTVHQGERAYLCDMVLDNGSICGAGFDRSSGLSRHRSRFHDSSRYFCTICKANDEPKFGNTTSPCPSFSTYYDLQAHNRSAHPPKCLVCSDSYPTDKQMNRHLELDHGIIVEGLKNVPKPTPFACPEASCNRVFTKRGNLNVHIHGVHVQARPFVCNAIDVHSLNNVHGWNGQGACLRSFKTKSQLEEHIRTIHLGMEHRHKSRLRAKKVTQASPEQTGQISDNGAAIVKLTGSYPAREIDRSTHCPITGCNFSAFHEYDLNVHLRTRHGLEDEEVQEARLAKPTSCLNKETSQLDASQSFDGALAHPGTIDAVESNKITVNDYLPKDFEHSANNDGDFWIQNGVSFNNSELTKWETDKTEMQFLIGEGHGWEDDIFIDPALAD